MLGAHSRASSGLVLLPTTEKRLALALLRLSDRGGCCAVKPNVAERGVPQLAIVLEAAEPACWMPAVPHSVTMP